MAKNETRRPTPRKKVKPEKVKVSPSRPERQARAPKLKPSLSRPTAPAPAKKAPTPAKKAAGPARGSTPAFLQRGVQAVRRQGAPATRPDDPRERRQRHQRETTLRFVIIGVCAVLGVALALLVAYFVLRDSSTFEITSVEVEPTEHVSLSDMQSLAQVPAGSTLLNVDTSFVEESIKKNPWVSSVSFERVFPHTLKITVTEQRVDMLVLMSSGSVAWYLGDAGTWIQPTKIEAAEGQSVNDAALAQALADGCLLITDVPATVSPAAGSVATDEVLDAVAAFRRGFSEEFLSQVVSFSAASPDSITCTLKNGVEILLGSPTDIAAKETVVTRTLEQHPGAVTYINVRVVTDPAVRPTVRLVDSDNVEAGDGVSASAPDEGQAAAEDLMLGARLVEGLNPSLICRARELFGQRLDATIEALLAQGLLEEGRGRLVPTKRGWLLGNELYGALWDLAPGEVLTASCQPHARPRHAETGNLGGVGLSKG